MTTATLVLPGTAPEADWHAARRHGVTASEIAVVMGLSPYGSPYALYHVKTGDLDEHIESDRFRLGHVLEPYICALFAERHPEFGVVGDGRALFARRERPWQMATPDRIVYDAARTGVAVFDAKTSGSFDGYGDDGTDEIPVHYRCQILWQMDVMGVREGYLGCLFLPSGQYRTYRIAHEDEKTHDWLGAEGCPVCCDQDAMRREAESFLARLRDGNVPEVDWRPATGDALKRLHPSVEDRDVWVTDQLAAWYRAACRNLSAAEAKKKLHENRLRDQIGSGRRALTRDGQPVATRQVYDVKEAVRKAYTVNKLVPARTPKEKP